MPRVTTATAQNAQRKGITMDFDELDAFLSTSPPGKGSKSLFSGSLSLKERFRRTMFFQENDLLPNFEFGYWDRTLEVWRGQGLPDHVVDEATAYEYFGIENWDMVNINSNPLPLLEEKVLEETDEYTVYRDGYGCVARINKHGDKSIPHFLEFPVKDRASWESFQPAFDPAHPQRWEQFNQSIEWLRHSDAPVGIFGGSMAGVPRNLIGFQGIATMQYEDPQLLTDIIDTFGATTVAVLEAALPKIQVDFCMGWEDICFNKGPILSPDFFRTVVAPWYRRIADLLVLHGCCVYTTDTDGNIMPIAEIFLDHGMNTMFPVEVHGGSDPAALRNRFGKRIRLWGGVDKLKLAQSKDAIDLELDRLRPYVEQGGFIPGVDHRVPADVPLENYLYYLDRKREVFHVGGDPQYTCEEDEA